MESKVYLTLACGLSALFVGCANPSSSQPMASLNQAASDQHPMMSLQQDFIQRDTDTNLIANEMPAQTLLHEKFTYLTGTARKWNGTIGWSYNPAGQPTFLNTQDVVNTLIAATRQWEVVSGVKFQYLGISTATPTFTSCNGSTVVGWAPLSNNTVGYTQACYSGSTFSEFDMQLDNRAGGFISNLSILQETAVHEFGHALGMGHTDISPAVMTPVLSSMGLVQDDIDGVRTLYGLPAVVAPIPTPTPTPTPAPAVPATWTTCAQENQTCSFTGTRTVRYGANGVFASKTATSSVACTNAVFGDPLSGVVKHCEYSASTVTVTPPAPSPTPVATPAPTPTAPTAWTTCAQENQACGFTGTRTVRYGANGVFVSKTLIGPVNCSNSIFGDPVYGVAKHCELSAP